MALKNIRCFITFSCIFFFLVSSPIMAKKPVYGYLEPVTLYPGGLSITAKLDTGADTASLSATDIHLYEKDGEEYVRFKVSHSEIKRDLNYDLPLIRHMKIKGRATAETDAKKPHLRPVVGIQIYFDGKPHIISVNLIDRTHFSTPMLLGRKALAKLGVIVDGAARNTIIKRKFK